MIVEAVIILIVILLIANIGVGIFNSLYPPCSDINEYFESARKIPNSSIVNLKTVSLKIDTNYNGTKESATKQKKRIKSTVNKKLMNAIDVALNSKSTYKQENSSTQKLNTNGNKSALFDIEMEGLSAGNKRRNAERETSKPSNFVDTVEKDGYKDMRSNDW